MGGCAAGGGGDAVVVVWGVERGERGCGGDGFGGGKRGGGGLGGFLCWRGREWFEEEWGQGWRLDGSREW